LGKDVGRRLSDVVFMIVTPEADSVFEPASLVSEDEERDEEATWPEVV
jgi:hypothetical protein